jgi:hypothetical protein
MTLQQNLWQKQPKQKFKSFVYGSVFGLTGSASTNLTPSAEGLPYWPILPSTKDIPILQHAQSGPKRKRLQIFNILSRDCCKMTPGISKKYLNFT